jgi:glycerol-3-phosphate dehydrogenase
MEDSRRGFLFKGHDCLYNYTNAGTGETIAYKAKLVVNASGFASQKAVGQCNRAMGRNWVKCLFHADKKDV